ncbi:hypothetical protein LIA77_03341 [Sarocladium implicatum]|nr:hypothetical protein LIA77_03341 [Sarocladium implicatum]
MDMRLGKYHGCPSCLLSRYLPPSTSAKFPYWQAKPTNSRKKQASAYTRAPDEGDRAWPCTPAPKGQRTPAKKGLSLLPQGGQGSFTLAKRRQSFM